MPDTQTTKTETSTKSVVYLDKEGKTAMSGTTERFIRSGLSVFIAAAVSFLAANPYFMALSPFLQTASKAIRANNPNNEWVKLLPF